MLGGAGLLVATLCLSLDIYTGVFADWDNSQSVDGDPFFFFFLALKLKFAAILVISPDSSAT